MAATKNNFKVLFIYPNMMLDTLVPIHIPLLSACLKEKGFEVDLFDATFYKTEQISFDQRRVELLQLKPFNLAEKGLELKETDIYDDLAKKVADYKPDLIAVTLVEDTWNLAQSMLEKIRNFHIPVIAGGVFVTFSPEEVISHPAIDMICVGEGEEALVELCQKMSEGEDYSSVRNIWVKKPDGGIVKNQPRPLIDVNKLPFLDYDIFGRQRLVRPMFGKVLTLIHVEMGRGCPYQCTYCEGPRLQQLFAQSGCGTYYRRKKMDRLVAELKYLVDKYRPDFINFNSETFLATPADELAELAKGYKTVGVPFWCQTRPETITEEKIKILKEMGVNAMNFGIEQGNEKFRKTMLKRYGSNQQIIDGLRMLDKYEIPYTVNNIMGFPDETRELIFDTIELNRQINPRTINCYIFTPYKGTDLYKYCLERGYLKENAKTHHVLDGAGLSLCSVSYEELKGIQRTFLLYVRFPKSEWPEIQKAEKFDEEGNRVFEKYKKLYHERYFS